MLAEVGGAVFENWYTDADAIAINKYCHPRPSCSIISIIFV